MGLCCVKNSLPSNNSFNRLIERTDKVNLSPGQTFTVKESTGQEAMITNLVVRPAVVYQPKKFYDYNMETRISPFLIELFVVCGVLQNVGHIAREAASSKTSDINFTQISRLAGASLLAKAATLAKRLSTISIYVELVHETPWRPFEGKELYDMAKEMVQTGMSPNEVVSGIWKSVLHPGEQDEWRHRVTLFLMRSDLATEWKWNDGNLQSIQSALDLLLEAELSEAVAEVQVFWISTLQKMISLAAESCPFFDHTAYEARNLNKIR